MSAFAKRKQAAASTIQAHMRGKAARKMHRQSLICEFSFRHATIQDALAVQPTIQGVPYDDEWRNDKATVAFLLKVNGAV